MAIAKRALLAVIKKVIKLEEAKLKAGHHQGLEKQVEDVLDGARKIVASAED